ncbi:hypothetical protein F3Y22_tig00110054pilonHSYRG00017 [Hibiscus syriacus]|uniref:Uncharacterized protein n=1 Tax=Hibiscus syriacus TaxID=106335 RepID=A0A6A3BLR6_HIBSY|nr:hypothetical protein F3Y22_tig00110054pilonHSYRG00017 [Hibiscus syriacus]
MNELSEVQEVLKIAESRPTKLEFIEEGLGRETQELIDGVSASFDERTMGLESLYLAMRPEVYDDVNHDYNLDFVCIYDALSEHCNMALRQKGLMYIYINIVGQMKSVIRDTRETDQFMFKKAADNLGLKVENESGYIKIINSKEVPINGVTRMIELRIGGWKCMEDFKVHLEHNSCDVKSNFPSSMSVVRERPNHRVEGDKESVTEVLKGILGGTSSSDLAQSVESAKRLKPIHTDRTNKENDILSDCVHIGSKNMANQKRLWGNLTISSVNNHPRKESD